MLWGPSLRLSKRDIWISNNNHSISMVESNWWDFRAKMKQQTFQEVGLSNSVTLTFLKASNTSTIKIRLRHITTAVFQVQLLIIINKAIITIWVSKMNKNLSVLSLASKASTKELPLTFTQDKQRKLLFKLRKNKHQPISATLWTIAQTMVVSSRCIRIGRQAETIGITRTSITKMASRKWFL